MLRATTVLDHTHHVDATITLDETARHRRRMVLTTDRMANGSTMQFLLDLPKARLLRHGEALQLENGMIVEIRSAPENLYEVTGRDSCHLLSLAWQIGNRHLAAEITPQSLRIRRDHVIRTMLEGLGATVREVSAPFNPEGGAYGNTHHDHAEDHEHGHFHAHPHGHDLDGDHG